MRSYIVFLTCTLAFLMTSCADKKGPTTTLQPTPTLSDPAINESAVTSGPQAHYICPNNCEGSGGDVEGICPNCGSTYVHNTAFHNQSPTPEAQNPLLQQTIPSTAAGGATGVFHYICPEGHPGGDAAGNCPTCGATLVHNDSYHNQTAGQQQSPLIQQQSPLIQQQSPLIREQVINPASGQTPPPATNSAGLYHYICSQGHPGSATAGNCATCGAALVHNAAYHN